MDTNKWLSEWLPLHGMPGVKHMRREDIVKALEDHAAERERAAVRAALEQACKALEQAREWARGHDTPVKHGQVLDYIRGMDKAEEYIRAILNDNTTTKETTT